MRQSYLQVSQSVSPVENVPENVLLRATLTNHVPAEFREDFAGICFVLHYYARSAVISARFILY